MDARVAAYIFRWLWTVGVRSAIGGRTSTPSAVGMIQAYQAVVAAVDQTAGSGMRWEHLTGAAGAPCASIREELQIGLLRWIEAHGAGTNGLECTPPAVGGAAAGRGDDTCDGHTSAGQCASQAGRPRCSAMVKRATKAAGSELQAGGTMSALSGQQATLLFVKVELADIQCSNLGPNQLDSGRVVHLHTAMSPASRTKQAWHPQIAAPSRLSSLLDQWGGATHHDQSASLMSDLHGLQALYMQKWSDTGAAATAAATGTAQGGTAAATGARRKQGDPHQTASNAKAGTHLWFSLEAGFFLHPNREGNYPIDALANMAGMMSQCASSLPTLKDHQSLYLTYTDKLSAFGSHASPVVPIGLFMAMGVSSRHELCKWCVRPFLRVKCLEPTQSCCSGYFWSGATCPMPRTSQGALLLWQPRTTMGASASIRDAGELLQMYWSKVAREKTSWMWPQAHLITDTAQRLFGISQEGLAVGGPMPGKVTATSNFMTQFQKKVLDKVLRPSTITEGHGAVAAAVGAEAVDAAANNGAGAAARAAAGDHKQVVGGGEAAAMGAHAVDGGTGGGCTAGVAAAATTGGDTGTGPRQGEAGVAQVANLAAETAQAMHPRGGRTSAVRGPATVGTSVDAGMATAQAPVEVTGCVESNTGGGAEEAWVSGENDVIEDEDTTNYDAFKEWVGEVPRAAKGEAGKHRRGGGDDDDLGARSGRKVGNKRQKGNKGAGRGRGASKGTARGAGKGGAGKGGRRGQTEEGSSEGGSDTGLAGVLY
ncbi:hypothetical protein VOLCADRAFT_107518 [Volvox carteri f. nagariensis]|uniref:Uncharacterized protein n=1 Tax=Volvox carteri f. nagariensis TaxID=3068 RepID=D8UEJ8_VOLCA|nr:uncharacterized protein VOLCADRAFT_107518 [Volvox carteri f. nagariensis]EFJ41856.1 hypothetical protein VOLCADRAFT_107518 [Volvox carteri f. nagariensis]|eukprot:XP_002957054.1 hypothetical protein VOLCADRAFT_107518 [Volvox carteri f. nagariensis]